MCGHRFFPSALVSGRGRQVAVRMARAVRLRRPRFVPTPQGPRHGPFESEEAACTTLRTEKSCFVTFLTPRFARGWSVLAAHPPKSPARTLLDTAADGWNKKNPLLRQATRGFDVEPSRKRIAPHDGLGGLMKARSSPGQAHRQSPGTQRCALNSVTRIAGCKTNSRSTYLKITKISSPYKAARRLKPPRRGVEGDQRRPNILIRSDLWVCLPVRPTGLPQYTPV